jgi:four helix bundle protein
VAEGEDLDEGDYRLALEGSFARDFVFSRQIRSAALSVPSNIDEGFERGNRNEFHQFLSIAKSSAAEVRSDLYTALDIGYLEEKRFAILLRDGEEVSRIIGGLRRAVDQQRHHKSQSSVLSLPLWRNLVDARDLKSRAPKGACRFESGRGHHVGVRTVRTVRPVRMLDVDDGHSPS